MAAIMRRQVMRAAIAIIICIFFFPPSCYPNEIDEDIPNACLREKFIQQLKNNNLDFTVNEKGWIVYIGNRMTDFKRVDEEFREWRSDPKNAPEFDRVIHQCPR